MPWKIRSMFVVITSNGCWAGKCLLKKRYAISEELVPLSKPYPDILDIPL
jgi:hypothetical protein